MDPNKIDIIKKFHIHHKQRDVISYLGLVGYYQRFIKYFNMIDSPLFSLLPKDVEFCWTNLCQEEFEGIK